MSSLVTIAESHSYYAINGVVMALKGSDEWAGYMENIKVILRRNDSATESDREEMISDLSSSAALPIGETGFQALGCGRSRPLKLLLDKEKGTICEVFPQHKQAHVFTQGYKQNENYLGDAAQKYRYNFDGGVGGREAFYDGSLGDALMEFEHAGYKFTFYDGFWAANNFEKNGNPSQTLQKSLESGTDEFGRHISEAELPMNQVLARLL